MTFRQRLAYLLWPGASVAPPALDPRLEESIKRLAEAQEKTYAKVRQIESRVASIVRSAQFEGMPLPYPERLTSARFQLASQGEEDGILWSLLQHAGVGSGRFVELGSGMSGGSCAFLAAECGWPGMMVELDRRKAAHAVQRFPRNTVVRARVTPDNVNALLSAHGFDRDVDVLSLDIDSNDYWVWRALTVRPRIAIIEYNSAFGAERAVTIPFTPKFNRKQFHFLYYGASLAALAGLGETKGYRLVACSPSGNNAFFLREDVAREVPAVTPQRAYYVKEKYAIFLAEAGVDPFELLASKGLPLVDVSTVEEVTAEV